MYKGNYRIFYERFLQITRRELSWTIVCLIIPMHITCLTLIFLIEIITNHYLKLIIVNYIIISYLHGRYIHTIINNQ